ncbi:MAG: response regulator transcription factor [Caldilineales bacterium]|nr:response regulator transcription factor [Caldilineales bacterium]
MRSAIQVVILTQAALHRAAWRALLSAQPDIEIVGTAAENEATASLFEAGRPATVLADIHGLTPAFVRELVERSKPAGILALVVSYELAEILPLLRAGALGCISGDASVADLARAIIAVGRGELSLPPDVAGRALAALARGETPGATLIEPLTGREKETLALLARGYSNKDIAQSLFLSVRTVEAHLRNIYGKLAVRSRTEAALWAVQQGYGGEDK